LKFVERNRIDFACSPIDAVLTGLPPAMFRDVVGNGRFPLSVLGQYVNEAKFVHFFGAICSATQHQLFSLYSTEPTHQDRMCAHTGKHAEDPLRKREASLPLRDQYVKR